MVSKKIILLCHGRKHEKYASYFKKAIHIDGNKRVKPDIVCNIRNGIKTTIKADLIQSVYWPQLHREGLIGCEFGWIKINEPSIKYLRSRIVVTDGNCTYNHKLLNSITNSLKIGGYFAFNQTKTDKTTNKLMIEMMKYYGFKKTNIYNIERKCKIEFQPKFNDDDYHEILCFKKIK